MLRRLLSLFLVLISSATALAAERSEPPADRWWSDTVEQALAQAGTNRQELARALDQTPVTQREGIRFLLENMPRRDLQKLSAAFLLEHLALAYRAWEEAPWKGSLPLEIFLNEVLPYASLNEQRENWRARLREICAPLVKDCRTPAEAGRSLNQKLFGLVKVRYSTQRRRPDQGPLETMESGLASCTGLSILLVDACRAVGVPARVAGTPSWVSVRGNHTWVEIWDGGWHFTGAAEQDPNGLDRGWFGHNASQALKDDPDHAIYASSFKKTGLSFPLAWAPWVNDVGAVNVTDRYTPKAKPADPGKVRLLVKVLDRPGGGRVAAKVTATDAANGALAFEGMSKDESADLNDSLALQLPRQRTYVIEAEHSGQQRRQEFTAGTNAQEVLVVCLTGVPPGPSTAPVCAAPAAAPALAAPAEAKGKEPSATVTAATNQQASWKFPCPQNEIARYTAYHIHRPPRIDGRLDELAWQQAPRSPRFIDILTGQPAIHGTWASVLWDDENLYVAYHVEEPFVHAKFTTNNSPIYFDNDVEMFIAGRDAYYEFELNAFNTTYEVFFIWADAYERGGFARAPEFGRPRLQPFNGVDYKTHPRGGRLGNFDWHFPGKKTAVFIDGTVNDDTDRDRGWTAELAFPWKGMEWLAKSDGRAFPPKDNDVWRIDFSRFNQYKEAPPAKDSGGWFWSRHGVWDSHIPECFPYIRFTIKDVGEAKAAEQK